MSYYTAYSSSWVLDTELSPKTERNLGMGLRTSEYKMNKHTQENIKQLRLFHWEAV